MSETQTQQTTEDYVPQHVLANEPEEDATKPLQQSQDASQEPVEGAEDKPEVDAAEEHRKAERRREAQRIAYLTKQRYAEKARADALEQQIQQFRAQQGQPQQPSQQEFDALVERRAAALMAEQQRQARFSEWDQHGREQFGQEKFLEACNTVASFAAGSDAQRAALVDVAMDTEGGQRAIMELAENPEEAERILAMPPHRMALAIAKLAAPPATPAKPVSHAPPPIRPPSSGRARGEPDPERGDYGSFERWSAKVPWRR